MKSNDQTGNTSSKKLQGKSILLVNIGTLKKKFILEVMHRLGLRVVALHDKRPEWAEPYVSDWIIVQKGKSVEQTLAAIRKHCKEKQIRLDGAITFWEEEIPLLAKICEKFDLIGNSFQASLNTRSKFAMQELLQSHGEPSIRQHLLRSEADLSEAIEKVGFPAVMKPLYGSDSLSVVYANSPTEARRVYKFVLKSFTSPYEGLFKYEKGLVVYQEYIPGKEFSVECYCQSGIPVVTGSHEKTPIQLPFFVETGDIVPPKISTNEQGILEQEAKAALTALGVENSLAHVELKLTPDGTPHIIEVASRMGGDDIYSSIREAYGFDMVRAGCEIALGIPVSEKPSTPRHCLYAKYIIPEQSGVIAEMKGFDQLSAHPNFVDYHIAVSPGDFIDVPPKGFDTAGWILIKGKDHAETERVMENIMQTLTITTKSS